MITPHMQRLVDELEPSLRLLGYKLCDTGPGRRTYVHNGDTHQLVCELPNVIGGWLGFARSRDQLFTFTRGPDQVELEPGGAGTSGHNLHLFYMPEVPANEP